MKNQTKRLVSVLLAAVMLLAVLPVGGAFAVTGGKCGDDLTWTLDESGTMTISGSGEMYDWADYDEMPWYDYTGSIKTAVIENGVTSIGDYAFYNCYILTSVTIPDSVTSIGYVAFAWCESLTSATIGNSVTSIGDYAFYNCYSLTSATIPDSVTSIGKGAFSSCSNLTSVTIGNSVTSIGKEAFFDCFILTSVTIGNSVTSIGSYAFERCDSLTSVTIPDSVTSIGYGAFGRCRNLKNIAVDKNNSEYASLNGILFNKKQTTLIQYPAGKTDITYTIPNSVTSIGKGAFKFCNSLTSVTIGNSVTSIGDYAFMYCDSLTSVTIPNSVTNIGCYAFLNCRNMKSIIIPSSVTSIGEYSIGYYRDYNEEMEYYLEVMTDFTIYGQKGSTAEKYAKDNGFKFVDLSHTHSYKSAVTKKATCTADGVMTYTCSCGDKYTKVIKATGHKYTTSTVKATQTKDGSTVTKCTVCGAVKSKTVIAKASSVKLSKTSFTYNGKAQKPSVTVKDSKGKILKNGTDYTVKYSSGCKNVGQYTVTITFKGKYSGTKTLTFKIVPKGTSISKLTAGKKQFTAKWSKQTTQTTGYELQYSTKSSMSGAKTVNVSKNKTTSSTVKKLKNGKKYYVRIRTYKTVKVNGKSIKLYSSWSKVKNVKTK